MEPEVVPARAGASCRAASSRWLPTSGHAGVGNGDALWSAIGGLAMCQAVEGADEYSTHQLTRCPVHVDLAEWRGVEPAISTLTA